MVKDIESKFLIVKCSRCSNQQKIFGKSTHWIKCLRCNKLLGKPTGGKLRIKAKVTKVITKVSILKPAIHKPQLPQNNVFKNQ